MYATIKQFPHPYWSLYTTRTHIEMIAQAEGFNPDEFEALFVEEDGREIWGTKDSVCNLNVAKFQLICD